MSKGGSHVLVVAIGDYENDEPLDAVPDAARRLVGALTAHGYHPAPVDLIGTRLEPYEIATTVHDWLQSRSPSDRLLVAWSGHGRMGKSGHFLITASSPPRSVDLVGDFDACNATVLARRVFASSASYALLIVDACYSGGALDEIAGEWNRVRATTTTPPNADRHVAVMTSAHALATVPAGAFATALHRVLFDDPGAGGVNRSWDDGTEWIDLYRLRDALHAELGIDAHVDLNVYQTVGMSWASSDGRDWLANPRFAGRRPPELVDVLRGELAGVTAADEHFDLSARGIEVGSTAWLFSGRTTTLRQIVEFCSIRDHGVMVVTGPPGVGKSAVLGRVVTLSVPGYRRLAVERHVLDDVDPGTLPPPEIFDAAIHARAKSTPDVVRAIARALGFADLGSDDLKSHELLGRLANQPGRITLVVDALDEALRGHQTAIAALCRRLGDLPGVRVLIGCRYHLDGTPLSDLEPAQQQLRQAFGPDAVVVDVADDPTTGDDFAAYVRNRLSLSHPGGTYDIDAIASTVAHQAIAGGGYFLYVRLVTRTIESSTTISNDLPGSALDAFHADLFARFGPDVDRVDELLAPLAWSFGAGLPTTVWAQMASVLSPTEAVHTVRDVNWVLGTAGWHIIQAEERGVTVYRLAHDVLAQHYRQGRATVETHRRIVDRLADGITGRRWLEVDPYVTRHLADHASRANCLQRLITDPWYLAVSEPSSLLVQLRDRTMVGDAARIAEVYRRVATRLADLSSGERLALFHLTALQEIDGRGEDPVVKALMPPEDTPWRAKWAAWRPSAVHETLDGHTGGVRSVAVGRVHGRDVIVSGGDDGTVRVWDTTGATPVVVLDGHTGWVNSVAVGRVHGRDVIVSASNDRTVRVWDPTGTTPVVVLDGHTGAVLSVAVGRVHGRDVIVSGSADDGTVRVWDPTGPTPLAVLDGHADGVRSVAVGRVHGRDVIVSASGDRTVRVWDPTGTTPAVVLDGHTGAVNSVAVGRVDGRDVIVSASNDRTVRVWDPTGTTPAVVLDGHTSWVNSVAVGRVDGRDVIVSGGLDETVRVWDPTGTTPAVVLDGHTGWVNSVAVGRVHGRDVIVSGSLDETVRVWDPTGTTPVGLDGHTRWVFSLAVGRVDGRDVIVSGGADRTVRVWDPTGTTPVVVLDGHTGAVFSVAVGRVDGRDVIVSGSADRTVRVWDPTGTTPVVVLDGHTDGVRSVAVGRVHGRDVIVSASNDRTVRVWDPTGTTPVVVLDGHTGAVRSVAAGRVHGRDVIVSASNDRTVRVWDPTGTAPAVVLDGHTSWVNSVAVGRVDGRDVIVSGSADRTVRVWDPTGTTPVVVLDRHTRAVNSVAVGRVDGRDVIVSGSADRTVRVWDPAAHSSALTLPINADCTDVAVTSAGLLVASTPKGLAVVSIRTPYSENSDHILSALPPITAGV